ncbi:MAG: RNA polymerase factor sigma-54 [Dysgonamonadaceae bacterium]|jgi:RNA polymerase sigma-54 factor|nr:RNA polymerase factor sigma-54 [Dysgonamonadaceae bacterium]
MIRQQLTTRLQQKLSPLQIQQIKLLELNALEIENRINRELEDNPALEEITDTIPDTESGDAFEDFNSKENDSPEDFSLGDYLCEDDIPDYKLQQNYYSKENGKEEIPYSESESFQEYLLEQLRLKNLSEKEFKVAEYLIGNIDEDGYMRRDPEAISDDLAFQYGMDISSLEIERSMKFIKELDPPGVGASDLRDCLLLQLQRKEKTPARKLAILILESYFEVFSKKQYDKIVRGLNTSEKELKEATKEITLLNPRPGGAWESIMETKMAQIVPDFYVEAVNGELVFSMLEKNIPELRINKEYGEMLKDYSEGNVLQNQNKKEALLFVKQKLDSAKWFIDAIKQRNTTLEKTMLAIIEIQRNFFLSGEESDLKPMILKDVSEKCGYDISTISRVSNSKYVQTNWGVYPLKYFFSESMTNEEGEKISTREIKVILKQYIDNENKKDPLTDDALMKELKAKGYDIARRTIAKYREQLNIPVARLRKDI